MGRWGDAEMGRRGDGETRRWREAGSLFEQQLAGLDIQQIGSCRRYKLKIKIWLTPRYTNSL